MLLLLTIPLEMTLIDSNDMVIIFNHFRNQKKKKNIKSLIYRIEYYLHLRGLLYIYNDPLQNDV